MKRLFRTKSGRIINQNEEEISYSEPCRLLKANSGESLNDGSEVQRSCLFRATHLWNNIITHLKTSIDRRRNRYRMRCYDNSFTGKEAVDGVLEYTLNNPEAFPAEVNRKKCAKLCQSFVDRSILEPVTNQEDETKRVAFGDNSNRLYRFKAAPTLHIESIIDEDMEVEPAAYSMKGSSPKNTTVKMEEVYREVALAEILKLIDIPFVDDLLPQERLINKKYDTNNAETNKNDPRSTNTGCPWVNSGLECLEYTSTRYFNHGFHISSFPHENMKKDLFNAIARHYNSIQESLLPKRFIDINLAILNLVIQEKHEMAKKAMQLMTILLPSCVRTELRRLIRFMSIVSLDSSCNLHRELDNRTCVLNIMSCSVIKHDILPVNLAPLLVSFMMENADVIGCPPCGMEDTVRTRMDDMTRGQSPSMEDTFCARVSGDEYKLQMLDTTELALFTLMSDIVNDPSLSIDAKNQRIKLFKKCHPNIPLPGVFAMY